MTENEVEDKLTSFITVFKYIDDKDIFQKVTRILLLVLEYNTNVLILFFSNMLSYLSDVQTLIKRVVLSLK